MSITPGDTVSSGGALVRDGLITVKPPGTFVTTTFVEAGEGFMMLFARGWVVIRGVVRVVGEESPTVPVVPVGEGEKFVRTAMGCGGNGTADCGALGTWAAASKTAKKRHRLIVFMIS